MNLNNVYSKLLSSICFVTGVNIINYLYRSELSKFTAEESYEKADHIAKNSLPLYNDDNLTAVQRLIAERTYCTKKSENHCDHFIKKLPVLMEDPILKPLFNIYALSLLSNWQPHIFMLESYLQKKDIGLPSIAYYLDVGKIIMVKSDFIDSEELTHVLTHEIAHAVMDYLFPWSIGVYHTDLALSLAAATLTGNSFLATPKMPSSPYSALDPLAKARFEEAEKATLINIYDFLDPWHEKVDPTLSSWELGRKMYRNIYDEPENQTLSSFLDMFKDYQQFFNHVEFIVRYYEAAARGEDDTIMNLLSPIAVYIREKINPIIENKLSNYYKGAFYFPIDDNGEYITNAPISEMTANNKLAFSLAKMSYNGVAKIIKQGVEQKYVDYYITLAAKKGEQAALAVLLKAAESAHMQVEGMNPLGWAIKHEHFDIAKEMINEGADFKSENIMGYAAYDWTEKHGHIDFADFLMHYDGDLGHA